MRFYLCHLLLPIALASMLPIGTAAADTRDQDAVRLAVERGEILPLTAILDAVRSRLPGEIVGIDVDQDGRRWLYEFRVLDGKGQLFEVYVDGHTGDIARIKEK